MNFASPGPMFQADIRSIVSLFGAAKELYEDPEKSALGDWRPELRAWLRVAGAQVKQNFERGGYPGGIWAPIKKESLREREVRKNNPWPPLTDVGTPTKDANWVEKAFTKHMAKYQDAVQAAERTLAEAQEHKRKWEDVRREQIREENKRKSEEKRKEDRARMIEERRLTRLGRDPLSQADNLIKKKEAEFKKMQSHQQFLSNAGYADLAKRKDFAKAGSEVAGHWDQVQFSMKAMSQHSGNMTEEQFSAHQANMDKHMADYKRKQERVVRNAREQAAQVAEDLAKRKRELDRMRQAREQYVKSGTVERGLSAHAKATRAGAIHSEDFVHHTQKNLHASDMRKYDETIAKAKKKLADARMSYTKRSKGAMTEAHSTQTWRGLSGAASNVVEGKYKGVSLVRVSKLMAEFGVRSGPGGIPYAAAMEYSSRGRPSRPYMVLSEPTMRALEGYVEQGIYARLEGARHFRDWWE